MIVYYVYSFKMNDVCPYGFGGILKKAILSLFTSGNTLPHRKQFKNKNPLILLKKMLHVETKSNTFLCHHDHDYDVEE